MPRGSSYWTLSPWELCLLEMHVGTLSHSALTDYNRQPLTLTLTLTLNSPTDALSHSSGTSARNGKTLILTQHSLTTLSLSLTRRRTVSLLLAASFLLLGF